MLLIELLIIISIIAALGIGLLLYMSQFTLPPAGSDGTSVSTYGLHFTAQHPVLLQIGVLASVLFYVYCVFVHQKPTSTSMWRQRASRIVTVAALPAVICAVITAISVATGVLTNLATVGEIEIIVLSVFGLSELFKTAPIENANAERETPLADVPTRTQRDVLYGWRVWRVMTNGESAILRSVYTGEAWPTGRRLEAHKLDAHEHHTGIHAKIERITDKSYGYHMPELSRGEYLVYGTVSLWGDVVRSATIYRAQFAYPYQIFIPRLRETPQRYPERLALARAIAASYRIDVDLESDDYRIGEPIEPSELRTIFPWL